MVLDPQFLPIWLNAAVMLALAGWLVAIDFSSRLHRVFALFLFIRGSTFAMGALRGHALAAGDVTQAAFLVRVFPYFHIAFAAALVYFLLLYAWPRSRPAKSAWVPWAWMGGAFGLMALYAADHSLYWTTTIVDGGIQMERGPLSLITASRTALFGIAAIIVGIEYLKSPRHSAGYSKFLILAGFTLAALQDGLAAAASLWIIPLSFADGRAMHLSDFNRLVPALALPLSLVALAILGRVAWQYRRHETMQEPRWFLLYVAPLPVITTILAVFVDGSTNGEIGTFMLGLWRLAFPFLVAYALLRHQLFEVDVRVKANVARAIMLSAFTVAFFLVMEAAEAIFAGDAPLLVGMLAAGLLAPIGQPLRALATRAADRLMPDTKPIVEQSEHERQQFYIEQFQLVAGDGRVTAKERHMLEELAYSLRIPQRVVVILEKKLKPQVRHAEQAISEDPEKSSALARVASALVVTVGFALVSQGIEAVLDVSSFTGGLAAAALLTLVIGPVEGGVDHWRLPRAERQRIRRRLGTFRHAVYAAWEDGSVTAKELAYLGRLQKELGLSWADRKKAEGRYALRRRARRGNRLSAVAP